MEWLVPATISTTINTAILALVYLYLYRQENRTSLLLFFISWSLYSLRHVGGFLYAIAPSEAILVVIQLLVLASSHLLLVAFQHWHGRKRPLIGWTVATTVAAVWIIAAAFSGLEFTTYTIPAFFYVGSIFVYAGITSWRQRSRMGVGNRIIAITLILWGLHKVDYPFLRPVAWFAPWGYLLGALAAVITAFGMILIYFEETRALLKESLTEKEVLLKEVHHRVKNNLTVLHSLIKNQIDIAEDHDLEQILRRLEDKVFAFVLIHTKLFEHPSVSRIDLRDYISQMTGHLAQSFGLPESVFHFEYLADERHADVTTVKSLGLILNELVTNSVKHAFPDDREKRIIIRFEKLENGRYRLAVTDNGTGINSAADDSAPKMSGLYLVALLCEEIKGTLSIGRAAGAESSVEFPRIYSGESGNV